MCVCVLLFFFLFAEPSVQQLQEHKNTEMSLDEQSSLVKKKELVSASRNTTVTSAKLDYKGVKQIESETVKVATKFQLSSDERQKAKEFLRLSKQWLASNRFMCRLENVTFAPSSVAEDPETDGDKAAVSGEGITGWRFDPLKANPRMTVQSGGKLFKIAGVAIRVVDLKKPAAEQSEISEKFKQFEISATSPTGSHVDALNEDGDKVFNFHEADHLLVERYFATPQQTSEVLIKPILPAEYENWSAVPAEFEIAYRFGLLVC